MKNNTLEGVECLVLGASAFQLPLGLSLNASGCKVHVASPMGNYPMVADPRFTWHDVDVTDLNAVTQLVKQFGLELVLTDQTDLPVSVIWEVNRVLGMQGKQGGDVRAFCDKGVCRKTCKQGGLPVPDFQVVSSAEEVAPEWEGREVVVKPVDSQGSRGVQFLKGGDVKAAVVKALGFSGSGKAIVEAFIRGKEYPVEGVICGGKYQTLAIGYRKDFECAPGIPSKCDYVAFDENDSLHLQLHEMLEAFAAETGVQRGMTHAEVIVDPGGRCFLVEVALRSGASFIGSHIVPCLAGVDVHQTLVHFAQGRDELAYVERVSRDSAPRVASFSYFYLEAGPTGDVPDQWPAVPGFVEHHYLPDQPTFLGCPKMKNQRYGPFILLDSLDSTLGIRLREGFSFADGSAKIVWD